MSNEHPPQNAENLEDLREEINKTDNELVRLLSQRARLSLAVGKYKAEHDEPVYRPFREQALLNRLCFENNGPLSESQLTGIYREILSVSRQLQEPQQVACLGPLGTFSYFAGRTFLGHDADFQLKTNLSEIFEAVSEGQCPLGIAPLENSLHGSVGESLDLFLIHPVHIIAEFFYRIRHSLLSREEKLDNIDTVYSHPQGLAQCGEWLRRNLPAARQISVDSTAKAAHLAAENSNSAAVSHVDLAAELNLNILAETIADRDYNHTRFVLLAPGRLESLPPNAVSQPSKGQEAKSSLLFTLPDRPGSLASILSIFSRAKINLSKLESRPCKTEDWSYVFFADVGVNLLSAGYERVLRDLRNSAHELRILGVYPPGRGV